jgi:ATP-binding cassette subfamily B protein
MKSIKKLLNFLWPLAKKYPFSFLWSFIGFGFGSILSQAITPLIFKRIVDTIVEAQIPSPEVITPLLTLVAALLIIKIIYNIFYRTSDYTLSYFESNMIRDIHDAVFKKLALHSYRFFTNNFAGSLVAKAKRITRSFETIYDTTVWSFWGLFISNTSVFIVLFLENKTLGLIFLVWAIAYTTIAILLLKYKIKYDLADASADSQVTANLADVITNIITVKIFGREQHESEQYETVINTEETARRQMWYFGNKIIIIQAILLMILQVGGTYMAIRLWINGSITAGTVVLVESYLVIIFNRLWKFGNAVTKFVKALSDSVEMIDIIEQPIDITDPKNPKPVNITDGVISFNNATFTYNENDDAVIEDFSLFIPAGQKVGLVGISGSGKTTLTKLLLRFADLDKGSITIDDQSVTSVKQEDLRSHIAFVPQEPLLFHRSILENIRYGKLDATENDVVEAAKQAHAHGFIEKLPKRYGTLVGERGIKLSGGERQRVAIARAILKDAPIVVLDEATSSLDSISEQYIQDALEKLIEKKTTIVIAHRLSTIQRMDRILVMKEGAIVEDGTHDELLKKEGEYHNLWSHQKSGFIE